jgi:hypothetical protein
MAAALDFVTGHCEQRRCSLPGKRASFAADAMSTLSKFYHVLGCSRLLMSSGAMTWSVSDGYHTSMLGARAILASFGILPYSFPGRTVLVDFFPEYGTKDQRRAFQKATKGIGEPVRLMTPASSPLLEQKELWKFIERLSNVADLTSPTELRLFPQITELLKERPWATRNKSLYDAVEWIWPDDIGMPPVSPAHQTMLLSTTSSEVLALSSFLDAVFELVSHYEGQFNAGNRFGVLAAPASMVGCSSPFVLV